MLHFPSKMRKNCVECSLANRKKCIPRTTYRIKIIGMEKLQKKNFFSTVNFEKMKLF